MAAQYADELIGKEIYQLPKRTIYYNSFNKKAYIIKDEHVSQYNRLSYRGILSIVIIAVGMILFRLVVGAIAAGVFVYLMTSGFFYFSFLKKLSVLDGFNPKNNEEYHAYIYSSIRPLMIIMFFVCLLILYVAAKMKGVIA